MFKAYNLVSDKGNAVPNQIVIHSGYDDYFQSYNSVIAHVCKNGRVTLDKTYWDYSRTTLKYLKQFLGVNSVGEIRENIASGKYLLADLN